MFRQITSKLFNAVQFIPFPNAAASYHYLASPSATSSVAGGSWAQLFFRTHIRCHFPRPNERKRIKKHGWKVRMSTPEGRRVIMRRILKGRHVLSH